MIPYHLKSKLNTNSGVNTTKFQNKKYICKKDVPSYAGKNQPAFKGINFAKNAKKFIGKNETRHIDYLFEKVGKYIKKEDNVGFYSTHSFFKEENLKKNIEKFLDPKKEHLNVEVEQTLLKSFVNAVTTLPKAITNLGKRVAGSGEKLNFEKELRERKSQLLGYFMEVNHYEKVFDNVFTGEKLKNIKKILKKENGAQKELKIFLKENNLNKKTILGKTPEDFEVFKEKILSKTESAEFIDELRKKSINASINKKIFGKTGSFNAPFSSDVAKLINAVSSSTPTAYFIGNDFRNLHMFMSDNEKNATKERNKRYRQQAAYMGTTLYIDNVINTTFRRISNKSLPFAVGLGVVNSIAANIISRKINGLPILPKTPEDAHKKPFVIEASPLRKSHSNENVYKNSQTYSNYKKSSNSLAFSGWASSGIETFKKKAVKALPAKMAFKDFEETYKTLEAIDPNAAKYMLRIAGKYMGHLEGIPKNVKDVKLEHLQNAAQDNGGKVIIGRNYGYRFGESMIRTVAFPFELIIGLGRGIVNLGLKVTGREKIEKASRDGFNPEIAVENVNKWIKQAKESIGYTGKGEIKDPEVIHKLKNKYGEKPAGFFGPNVMEYGNDKLSTGMKMTGFTTVPFLASDTYNDSIRETKNKNIAIEKTKQRGVQDITGKSISFWAVKSFNDIFKGLANHSLGGAALATFINCCSYEALTRYMVGQPVVPKTHEEMKEIEKKRLQKKGFIHRVLGKKFNAAKKKVAVAKGKVVLGSKKLSDNSLHYPTSNFINSKLSPSEKFNDFEKNLKPIQIV